MTKGHRFTRGNIVALTGVPNDVFTFWLRSDLIRPEGERERAGMRLRFTRGQVRIAAVLNEARRIGLNIDALRAIADTLDQCEAWIARHQLVGADFEPLTKERNRLSWTEVEIDDYLQYLNANRSFQEADRFRADLDYNEKNPVPARISEAVTSLLNDYSTVANVALPLLIDEGIINLHRNDAEDWVVESAGSIDGGLPVGACVMLDLQRILSRLDWNSL